MNVGSVKIWVLNLIQQFMQKKYSKVQKGDMQLTPPCQFTLK